MLEVLKDRKNKYGNFKDNARITQGIMKVIYTSPRYGALTDVHKECLHMIAHKIARCICGDVYYQDNFIDIIGYATRMLEYLKSLDINEQ